MAAKIIPSINCHYLCNFTDKQLRNFIAFQVLLSCHMVVSGKSTTDMTFSETVSITGSNSLKLNSIKS